MNLNSCAFRHPPQITRCLKYQRAGIEMSFEQQIDFDFGNTGKSIISTNVMARCSLAREYRIGHSRIALCRLARDFVKFLDLRAKLLHVH